MAGEIIFNLLTEHTSQKIISALKNQHDVNIETLYQKIGSENGTPIYQNPVSAKVNKDNKIR